MLALALAALVGALAAAGIAWRCLQLCARGAPEQLRAMSAELADRVRHCEGVISDQTAKLTAWKAEQDAYVEAVEGMLDSIETKRRRIAAAQSRASNGAQQPLTRADVERLARERGEL